MRWLELRNKQRNKETKTTKNAEHSLSSVEGECVIGSYEENSVCVGGGLGPASRNRELDMPSSIKYIM